MNEFSYDGGELEVSQEMKDKFLSDGFVLVKGLLSTKELDIVETTIQGPNSLSSPIYSFGREDGDGTKVKISTWRHPGEDTTGTFARMQKTAGTAAKLLGGEVYHYHSKIIMKDAHTGGKFVWHQDYGYWYNRAVMFPNMLTMFVALDRCDKGNGCLQVLRGSHRAGRIDHVKVGEQTGADLERVSELSKVLDTVAVEMDQGDALFFHCNLLHTSAQNTSDRRRWALLGCYNRVDNKPYEKVTLGEYRPMTLLSSSALLNQGVCRNFKGKEIVKPCSQYEFAPVNA